MKQFKNIFTFSPALIISGFIALVALYTVAVPARTNALALDLSGVTRTVGVVVNNVPIVNQILPTVSPTIPTVTVTPTQNPVTVTTVTTVTATTLPQTRNTTAATEQTTETNGFTASSNDSVAASTNTASSLNDDTIFKQSEIAAASAHIDSPAINYSSKKLDPRVATALFYTGIFGICAGSWAMIMMNRKTGVA